MRKREGERDGETERERANNIPHKIKFYQVKSGENKTTRIKNRHRKKIEIKNT